MCSTPSSWPDAAFFQSLQATFTLLSVSSLTLLADAPAQTTQHSKCSTLLCAASVRSLFAAAQSHASVFKNCKAMKSNLLCKKKKKCEEFEKSSACCKTEESPAMNNFITANHRGPRSSWGQIKLSLLYIVHNKTSEVLQRVPPQKPNHTLLGFSAVQPLWPPVSASYRFD